MIDDLPHVLLQLAGIGSSFFDESRSLLSEKYNMKRIRIVSGTCNYDEALMR